VAFAADLIGLLQRAPWKMLFEVMSSLCVTETPLGKCFTPRSPTDIYLMEKGDLS
jgi:hypothetical protein